MRRKSRRGVSLLLAIVFVITMGIGCTKKPDGNVGVSKETSKVKESVTLTVLANQDWVTKPYIKKAWTNYEDSTGNKLDIQVVPIDSGETVMQTKFATGDIPDIFMHFGGNSLTPYQPEKNFVDMSDEFWVDDIKDYGLIQAKVKDKVYGLPLWEGSICGILYNKELFSKYNIDKPTTEDEFLAACETLKNNGVTPIYMAFKDVWPIFPQFGLDVIVKDPDVLNKLNTNQIKYGDLDQFRSMMTFYKKLADLGYLGEKFSTNTFDGQARALGEETYGMVYCWDTWISTDLEAKYPGSMEKFGIMPIFLGVNEEGTYEGPNACLTYVPNKGKHVEEAIEFVRFLAQPENLNLAYDGEATQTYFKSVTTNEPSPQYIESKESIERLVNASVAWSSIIGFSQVEGVKPMQQLLLDDISVEETIQLMDEERIKTAKAQKAEGF